MNNSWVNYIKDVKNIYDDRISIKDYWGMVYPEREFKFPCACDLHGEREGHSFSYSEKLNVWSCWGHCRARGQKVVEYHLRFLRKTNPRATYVAAMSQLRDMFPRLGLPDISNASDYYRQRDTNAGMYRDNWANSVKKQLSQCNKNDIEYTQGKSIQHSADLSTFAFMTFTNYYLTKNDEGRDIT